MPAKFDPNGQIWTPGRRRIIGTEFQYSPESWQRRNRRNFEACEICSCSRWHAAFRRADLRGSTARLVGSPGHEGVVAQDLVLDICKKASELFEAEPNLLKLNDPITVVGDIHGQYYDLVKLLEVSEGRDRARSRRCVVAMTPLLFFPRGRGHLRSLRRADFGWPHLWPKHPQSRHTHTHRSTSPSVLRGRKGRRGRALVLEFITILKRMHTSSRTCGEVRAAPPLKGSRSCVQLRFVDPILGATTLQGARGSARVGGSGRRRAGVSGGRRR